MGTIFIGALASSDSVSKEESLGVPLEPSKLESPSMCLTFLGIEVDTTHLQLRLPREKLKKLEAFLETVLGQSHNQEGSPKLISGLIAACNQRGENPEGPLQGSLHCYQNTMVTMPRTILSD